MEVIALDSSVLIDYYRKSKKQNTFLFQLAGKYSFNIPAIVKYEIYRGDKKQDPLWESVFADTEILPFDDEPAEIAAVIYLDLKNRSQLIPTDDILIAATAIRNKLRLATLNKKDFGRIIGLDILTP
jgi:tRNA(fMet)-specific endonuclease VapC